MRLQFLITLGLISDSAAFFPNGHQEHAMTETAPGETSRIARWARDRRGARRDSSLTLSIVTFRLTPNGSEN